MATVGTEIADRRADETIRHGLWTFQILDDELVDLTYGGVVLVSGVRAVVRDRDWGTADLAIADRSNSTDGQHAVVTLRGVARREEIDCAAELTVELGPRAARIRLLLTPACEFETNRLGLVVLHPHTEVGRLLRVTHGDGTVESVTLPEHVSPHQPVRDIRKLQWDRDGLRVQASLHGCWFEMEDQRNWTDASFKTYSHSLDDPFPFSVSAGKAIEQEVIVEVEKLVSRVPIPGVAAANEQPWAGTFPALSTSASGREERHPTSGLPRDLESLLVECDTTDGSWRESLANDIRAASDALLPVDLRVIAEDPQLVLEALEAVPAGALLRAGAYDAATHVTERALWRALLSAAPEGCARVAGSRAHYAELNRTCERTADVVAHSDGVTFSVTPQMHARETRHILSSMQGQDAVARDARQLHPRVIVGPITLRPRFNAVATDARRRYVPADQRRDPRHGTPFAAAWAAASVITLAASGVSLVSLFTASELVDADGRLTAEGDVISRLTAWSGAPILPMPVHRDRGVAAVVIGAANRPVLLAANPTDRRLKLTSMHAGRERVFQLEPHDVCSAALDG